MGINVKAYDQASGVLNHVSSKLGIMNKQGLAMGIGFAGITMGIQAAMAAFQGLKQWIGESIKKYREFETAMAEVSTMLDAQSMKHLPNLEKGIVDLANVYGKSATDMASAMYQTLSASVDAGEALVFLETATKAATAGLTSTEVAVDAITSVMNAYGMSVSEAGRISDIMFQTVKRGKLRFEDLASTISMVAPIASQAGIAFEKISAALATLTRQGINASKATMSLRQLISNIINPATEAKEAAASFGIELDALHFRVVGIEGILQEMEKASKGNIAVLGQFIPNIRALQAALGLTGGAADGFTTDIDLMENSLGKTQEALAKIIDTSAFMVSQVQALSDEVDRLTGESLQEFDLMMKVNESSIKRAVVEQVKFRNSLEGMANQARTLIDIFLPWMSVLETIGGIQQSNTEINNKLTSSQEKLKTSMEDGWKATNNAVDIFETYGDQFITYGTAVEQFEKNMENIGHTTDEVTIALAENQEGYNMVDGALASMTSKLQDAQSTMVLLDARIEELNISIPKMEANINRLTTIKNVEDDLYRAGLALEGFAYAGDYVDKSTASMVSNLTKYESHLDSLQSKQDAFNLSSKKNSLEILQIQYNATGRRGRLSRTEKKQIEDLQRANQKNRIDQMSGDIQATEYKNKYYNAAKQQYEDYVTAQQHLLYTLNDTRQSELDSLNVILKAMETSRETYLTDLATMHTKEEEMAMQHQANLAKIAGMYTSKGMAVPSAISGIPEYEGGKPSWKWGRQIGDTHIPETGWYKLHEGESVKTKGATNAGGGKNVTITIAPITVNADIRSNMDVNHFVSMTEQAVASGLIDGVTTIARVV